MVSDNLSGIKDTSIKQTIFLAPGRLIQWCMYMGFGEFGKKGNIFENRRKARSPLLTYFYSFVVWAAFLFIIFNAVFGPSESSIRAIKANKVEMERKAMDVQYWKAVEAKGNKNWQRMVEIVKPLAKKDHAKSQAMLGSLYLQGVGVEKNKYKSMQWFESAARKGNAKAQRHMGLAYHMGVKNVSGGGWMYNPNLKQAIMWYERSIANGYEAVKEDLEKAVKMERKEKEIEDCFKRERYTKEGHPKKGEELRHAEAMCKGKVEEGAFAPPSIVTKSIDALAENNSREKSQNEIIKSSKFNQTHIKKLKALNSCKKCNLQGANLRNADLSESILTAANLSNADLSHANLEKSNLNRANLSGSNLDGARLIKAILTSAQLTNASFKNSILTKANLTGTNLTGANLSHASLGGANFNKTTMLKVNLTGADLTGANLYRQSLRGINLTRANLTNAKLGHVDFSGADLTRANLTGADLTDAKLDKATLCNTITPWGLDNSGCVNLHLSHK